MIFQKDPKTRYVDMAIYIDHHIYTGEYDPDLVYQYLYFLVYMLSKKKKYFFNEKSYDDFSIWLATKMYVRLTDPRQFDDSEKLDKITSILNYIKGILYAKKIEFNQQDDYQTVLGKFNSKYIQDFDDDALSDYYRPTIESRNNDLIRQSVVELLELVPQMFQKELKKSPYKNNEIYMNNLYLSCLLTFIKSTTPSNAQLNKLDKVISKHTSADISKISSGINTELVLWGVPEYLSDYVKLIYNRVRDKLVDEIKDSVSKYALTPTELEAVINSNYETTKKEE